jgi:hypothetical protein
VCNQLDRVQPKPGAGLLYREKTKLAAYREEFDSLNGEIHFLPFMVSSFGGIGPQANKFVSFIALDWRLHGT